MADPLEEAARAAAARAYCPYSGFRVGAALEASDGSVFVGCNVESAAYSPTLCAERTALGAAVAAGKRSFARLVVVGGGAQPAFPCGVCRQSLFEFSPGLAVTCTTLAPGGARADRRLSELLPGGFGPEDLGRTRPEG